MVPLRSPLTSSVGTSKHVLAQDCRIRKDFSRTSCPVHQLEITRLTMTFSETTPRFNFCKEGWLVILI